MKRRSWSNGSTVLLIPLYLVISREELAKREEALKTEEHKVRFVLHYCISFNSPSELEDKKKKQEEDIFREELNKAEEANKTKPSPIVKRGSAPNLGIVVA